MIKCFGILLEQCPIQTIYRLNVVWSLCTTKADEEEAYAINPLIRYFLSLSPFAVRDTENLQVHFLLNLFT